MNVALVQAVCRPERVNPTESLSVCGGHWNEIDGAEKATCLAFNSWGTLLSVGEKEGVVILWDFSSIPNIIKELDPKQASAATIPDIKQANACAWSPNGRILAVACELKAPGRKGTILLWEIESSTLMAAIACTSNATHIAFPPISIESTSCIHNTTLLLSCANGELQMVAWSSSENQESSATLHFQHDRYSQLQFQSITIDTAAAFTAICGDTATTQSTRNNSATIIAKYGHDSIFCVSSIRGGIVRLDPHTHKLLSGLQLPPISSVDLFVDATSLLVPSSKGIHEIGLSKSTPTLAEGRVYTAGAAVRAPWIMASKSPDGQFVLGIPQPRGLFVGEKGMFVWTTNIDEGEKMYHDHRFSGDMVAVAWHPSRETLAVVSNAGSVHLLEVPYTSSWPGAMYPPGFTLITDNVVYEEPEDEFDTNVKTSVVAVPSNEPVDIVSTDEADENPSCLKYIPASPLTTWNHEAPAFEDDDVSSIFSYMKARAPPPPPAAPAAAPSKSKKRKTGK